MEEEGEIQLKRKLKGKTQNKEKIFYKAIHALLFVKLKSC